MDWSLLLLFAAMVVLFWLMVIRPGQQRQKAAAELQASIGIGEQVMLSSGLFGTVADLTDEHAMLEVAPGVTIRVARGAIAVVNRDEHAADTHEEPADPERPTGSDESDDLDETDHLDDEGER